MAGVENGKVARTAKITPLNVVFCMARVEDRGLDHRRQ